MSQIRSPGILLFLFVIVFVASQAWNDIKYTRGRLGLRNNKRAPRLFSFSFNTKTTNERSWPDENQANVITVRTFSRRGASTIPSRPIRSSVRRHSLRLRASKRASERAKGLLIDLTVDFEGAKTERQEKEETEMETNRQKTTGTINDKICFELFRSSYNVEHSNFRVELSCRSTMTTTT